MPNWCSINMTITCKDDSAIDNVRQVIEMMDSIAEEKQKAMYLGTQDRYIFDSVVYTKDNSIVVEGVTKWYVNCKDFQSWMEFLISQGDDILSATLSYEELGCLVYGTFTYDGSNNKIFDKYIPIDRIPPYRESYSEYYIDILDAYLEENGVCECTGQLDIDILVDQRNKVRQLSLEERKREILQNIDNY